MGFTVVPIAEADIRLITAEELAVAERRLPGGKAPGPDAVPYEIIRIILREDLRALLSLFNVCWRRAAFLRAWKSARLVLLFEGGGQPPTEASSFRPIGLLDSIAKLYERLVLGKLEEVLSRSGGLSIRQHGFRRSTGTT